MRNYSRWIFWLFIPLSLLAKVEVQDGGSAKPLIKHDQLLNEKYNQKLMDAVIKNHYKLVERYLKLGANPNQLIHHKELGGKISLLQQAILHQESTLVNLLLFYKTSITNQIFSEKTIESPLFTALGIWLKKPNQDNEKILDTIFSGKYQIDHKTFLAESDVKWSFYQKHQKNKKNIIDLCLDHLNSDCLNKIYFFVDQKPFKHKLKYFKLALKENTAKLLDIYLSKNAHKINVNQQKELKFLIQSQNKPETFMKVFYQHFQNSDTP